MLALAPLKLLLAAYHVRHGGVYDVLNGMAEPAAGQGPDAQRRPHAAGNSLYDGRPHALAAGRPRRPALGDLLARVGAVQQGAQGAQQARYAYDQ